MASRRNKTPIHPGTHIKLSILPAELSVKRAAEMLGVGRPALSNLLNGKAALSPDMAMRFEKAFQADASALLEMQARYEEFEARARADDIAVRAYAPAYLKITARQIAAWADTIDARGQLPALLRTLVHSTGSNLTAVDFPAFDNSQRKGWDGQVRSGSATPWIPRGQSGWEFGCNKTPKTKADRDYQARTAGVPAKERKSTTFVFVTPRNWTGKHDWAKAKKTGGEWQDVRAFDASDLEQWLEQSIPAQTRMGEFQRGAGQEVVTLCQIWLEWAAVTEPALSRELFAPAAERHRAQLEKWLKAPPISPFVVAADSSLEALAFLSCALDRLGDSCPGVYERAVVIRSLEAFETIAGLSSNFVAIVASSAVERVLAGLHKKTHTIIVRGRNTVTGKADIALDLLGYEPFRKALRDTDPALNESRIDQLARESARSPTILRRRLAQVEAVKVPPWATDNTVARALIPFIFVGAWDSKAEADKEILRSLTDRPYEDAEQTIARLQTIDEPPIWSIGHLRGVVSKVDALYAAHRTLTAEDLKKFLSAAEIVLSERDPALELPEDERWAANLYGKSRNHSSALRRGLCDTLVLLAVHGNALVGERLGINLEADVSAVVRHLLTPSAESTWLSQKSDLPQYAEAVPDTFLSIIEDDLKSENSQIAVLFAPADTGMFGDCPRSGMLRALESLAWKPERLVRVTFILAKLCAWQIDDNWADKPMGTLKTIFWFPMPQTAASLDQRNRALETLTRKFPDVGWQICVDQFNPGSTIKRFSSKPRWRTDAYDAVEGGTAGEERQGQRKAVELALDWPAHDEHTLGDLVDRLEVLSAELRNRVWDLIGTWIDTGPSDMRKAALRERIRRCTLTRRRRRRDIGDAGRKRARQAYALLEPRNPAVRHQWLFLREWVEESADELEDEQLGHQGREERIARQRREALREVWAESDLVGIKQLCQCGDASRLVGWHMAEICTGVQKAIDFLRGMMAERSEELWDKCWHCITGFLAKLELQNRDGVLGELLAGLGSDEDSCIRLLCRAPFDNGTWQQVDRLSKRLKERYWREVAPYPSRRDASAISTFVDELLNVGRPCAAFHAAHLDWKQLDSLRMIRLLTELATNGAEPAGSYQFDAHYVSEALETLEQREDTSREDLARLEFLFVETLEDSNHGIRNLEAQLAETPALFMEALRAFKRDDGGKDPAEWQLSNSDSRAALARAAYALLTNASRIPGTQADGSIDLDKLNAWLEQVRMLAREYGRVEIGDEMIGQLLSHCPPDADGVWPCEPVREAIDDLGSQGIAIGMLVGIHNARGATWRDEGGAQERELAEQYRRWSREVAFEYPFTANMLDQIATSYDSDAKWWDNRDSVRRRLEY